MSTLVRLDEPSRRLPASVPGWTAFLSMAFRPLYLMGALFAAGAVLAWIAGHGGTGPLAGVLWHAHEMVWGFAGAIIVGFLLTAVATWTGQPAMSGAKLAGLVGLWIGARFAAAVDLGSPYPAPVLSVAFFLAAAGALALPIVRSRNQRNYVVPVLLLGFATTNLFFHLALHGVVAVDPRGLLHAGLLLVAAFIYFVGLRVIPFFAHRALSIPQVSHGRGVVLVGVGAPLVLAALVSAGVEGPLPLAVGALGAANSLHRLVHWWHRDVPKHPLLWILFAGYAFTGAGVGLVGLAQGYFPALLSGALHAIAVGGVGVLTLGMMTRTALGHTGRKLVLPPSMVFAYGAMLASAVLRLAAALPGPFASTLLLASGVCFAGAFVLFAVRYGPWLASTRADGLP